MHGALTAASGERRPKGTGATAAAAFHIASPLIFITVDLQGRIRAPHPGDTNTLRPYRCREQGFSPQPTTTTTTGFSFPPLPLLLPPQHPHIFFLYFFPLCPVSSRRCEMCLISDKGTEADDDDPRKCAGSARLDGVTCSRTKSCPLIPALPPDTPCAHHHPGVVFSRDKNELSGCDALLNVAERRKSFPKFFWTL